ncbi:MAG TPA: DUF5667 domain-containing protein [Micromonospora sp.]|nr:DUF5667 domain-containing protein [Micromonospora sp.]
MSTPVFYRRRAERFARLLEEAVDGPRHRSRATTEGDELAELVAVGQRISTLQPAGEIDPDFRTELRAMLMATATREGIGTPAAAGPATAARRAPRRLLAGRGDRRGRTRGVVIIGVAVGAITVSGISAASDNSLPGDALYGLKRSTERAQLAWARSDTDRGQRHLQFAQARLAEAHALRGDVARTIALLDDMDEETRQGVRLLSGAAVQRNEATPLDTLAAFVAGQREQLTALLDHTGDAARDRVEQSFDLLESATGHVEGWRVALTCEAPPSGKVDMFGPLPTDCA